MRAFVCVQFSIIYRKDAERFEKKGRKMIKMRNPHEKQPSE